MSEHSSIFSDFVGRYPLSKTLRFELKPMGATLDWIKRREVVEEDRERAENYVEVKQIIDDYHRSFIAQVLSSTEANFDWTALADAVAAYRTAPPEERTSRRAHLMEVQSSMRRQISACFTKSDAFKNQYKLLWGKVLIEDILPLHIAGAEDFERKAACLESFQGFVGYFTGYNEVRRSLYTDEEKASSIAYRIVNENFARFYDNLLRFEQAKEAFPDALARAGRSLRSKLNGLSLEEAFSLDGYNRCLSQSGIEWMNTLIGGWMEEDGAKVQGINECLNEAAQKKGADRIRLEPLYKQLLADREGASSSYFDEYMDDAQMASQLLGFAQELAPSDGQSLYGRVVELMRRVPSCDRSKLWVEKKAYSDLSRIVCGSWETIGQCLDRCRGERIGPVQGMSKALASKWGAGGVSLEELEQALAACGETADWAALAEQAQALSESVQKVQDGLRPALSKASKDSRLQQDEKALASIKGWLDAVLAFWHFSNLLDADRGLKRDDTFYGELDACLDVLRDIVPQYNMVRNRMTRKPYSEKKFRLNFGSPLLASGWDVNKERNSLSVLLRRDGLYYLGVMNAEDKPDKRALAGTADAGAGCYEKMEYKLIPNPHMMIPKVAFSKKGLEAYAPSQYILDGYAQGKHRKGDDFDLDFCHDLIDFFKEVIRKNEEWSVFGFSFSDTREYGDIGAFFREVAEQAYTLRFVTVEEPVIDALVEQGQLYLFQIYCKDFSEHSHGKKNLHTLYFENLFTPENLQDIRFKLSGGAELFFRPKSIEKPFVHRKGEKLVAKRMTFPDGSKAPIPEGAYQEIFRYVNGVSGTLSEEARKYLDSGFVTVKEAEHDIIKDRRYTQDKFFFHVPMILNYRSRGSAYLNRDVLAALHGRDDVNLLGVDRGERNLIYLTLIDQRGNVLEQRSLNIIGGQDYRTKLDQREQQRNEERRSWKSVTGIKDLKEGYLSLAVREVVDTMVRGHAVLVLEDLNFGFKRSRSGIEKGVYQKFEKMLIDKLNYLVLDKDQAHALQDGGVLRGYQLANQFESFRALGRQSGFLFYVPSFYTEAIDPDTGFVNLFGGLLKYRNEWETKQFFGAFDAIRYNREADMFEFTFRYSAFGLRQEDPTDLWTVCSTHDSRTARVKKNGCMVREAIDVTQRLKDLFVTCGIGWEEGQNLRGLVRTLGAGQVRELLLCFQALMQLRSLSEDGEVHILSPVRGSDGRFFRTGGGNRLSCADANSAYCIAMKGLQLLKTQVVPDEKRGGLRIDTGTGQTYRWLEWMQRRGYEG